MDFEISLGCLGKVFIQFHGSWTPGQIFSSFRAVIAVGVSDTYRFASVRAILIVDPYIDNILLNPSMPSPMDSTLSQSRNIFIWLLARRDEHSSSSCSMSPQAFPHCSKGSSRLERSASIVQPSCLITSTVGGEFMSTICGPGQVKIQ